MSATRAAVGAHHLHGLPFAIHARHHLLDAWVLAAGIAVDGGEDGGCGRRNRARPRGSHPYRGGRCWRAAARRRCRRERRRARRRRWRQPGAGLPRRFRRHGRSRFPRPGWRAGRIRSRFRSRHGGCGRHRARSARSRGIPGTTSPSSQPDSVSATRCSAVARSRARRHARRTACRWWRAVERDWLMARSSLAAIGGASGDLGRAGLAGRRGGWAGGGPDAALRARRLSRSTATA